MGPARSGTTITYQLVIDAFDAAYVDAFAAATMDPADIASWEDTSDRRAEFNRRLVEADVADRGVDSWEVADTLPEEFTMIDGSSSLRMSVDVDLELLGEIVGAVAGEANRPVVLKDPRSVRDSGRLAQHFPDAGFVFLRRNPAEILDSQQRALSRAVREDSEYPRILDPGLGPHMAGARVWLRVAGQDRIDRRLRRVLSRTLTSQMATTLAAYSEVPAHRRVLIDYHALCVDPARELEKLRRLGPATTPDDVATRIRAPRDPHPESVALARRRVSSDLWERWQGDWETE